MFNTRFTGTIFLLFGVVLFLFVAGDLIFRVLLGVLALHAINYGLRLRGMNSLHVIIYRWFDSISF